MQGGKITRGGKETRQQKNPISTVVLKRMSETRESLDC